MWLVLETTWKLQLEQYVAAHEINSVSCEAHQLSKHCTFHLFAYGCRGSEMALCEVLHETVVGSLPLAHR